MPLHIMAPRPDELNAYDEARLVLDEWQREFPDARRVLLVLDDTDLVITMTGPNIRDAEAVGICHMAAHAIMKEE